MSKATLVRNGSTVALKAVRSTPKLSPRLAANIEALANLATAPDTLSYWTGSGTAALTTLTSYARGLLACANSVAALAALGAQPVDTTLSALAGTGLGGAGQILTTDGTDFAWSGAGLTWADGLLADSGSAVIGATALIGSERVRVVGGTMGTPDTSSVLIAGGGIYAGNNGAASIQSLGGASINGAYASTRQADSQVPFLTMVKKSAAGVTQYTANLLAGGTGTSLYLQILDSAGAFYDNACWYDYTNKRWGMRGVIAPESSLHVGGSILAAGTSAAGRAVKSVYNMVAGGATSSDGIQIEGRAGGTSGWIGTITTAALTASRTYTMPDATGTVALLSLAQTWSANQFINASVAIGASALLASERLRVAGGTMGTPGTTDVLVAAGRVYAGDTGAASIQAAGGVTATSLTIDSTLFTSLPVNLTGTATLASSQTDTYSCGMRMVPTYTGAFAVTRHNYFNLNDITLAGGASVADACVFRFPTAAGTHKAVDAGTTKTSPGAVSAWVKVNVNGTIHYIPAYTSKTT